MNPTIFIGFDSRYPRPSQLLRYTIEKHISRSAPIFFLSLKYLETSFDFVNPIDKLASTEFTYSRFLIPYIMKYKGIALFLDNDMLVFDDIREILDLPMADYALRVVKQKHEPKEKTKMDGAIQTSYPRKNWSSVMLMNCYKLTKWTKRVVESGDGTRLHQFKDIPDKLIGDLPPEWNHLDKYEPGKTKLLHYTSGGPWFEKCKNHPHADIWNKINKEYVKEHPWRKLSVKVY